MRPSFFIFSLPRSGTSWLSVFLTGPHSYCFHEPTADYPPVEWLKQAEKRPEPVVGAIDTGAYNYAERIMGATPDMECLALYRDPLEINRSGRAYGVTFFDACKEQQKLKDLRLEPIYYSRFHDLGYLKALWERLIGSDFDRERAKQLLSMNIQRNLPELFSRPDLHETYRQWVQ